MRIFPLTAAFLFLAICSFSTAPGAESLTSKDGRIQIQIPAGYSEKTPPKPIIKLEAVNESAGATLLVISESQREFASLAEYGETVRDQMTGRLKDPQSDAGEKFDAAGRPGIRYEITGISSNGMRMAFLLTVIQTETRFNQVIGSCLRSNFAEHRQEFEKAAETIKELPEKQ